jgi:hypothetical protein
MSKQANQDKVANMLKDYEAEKIAMKIRRTCFSLLGSGVGVLLSRSLGHGLLGNIAYSIAGAIVGESIHGAVEDIRYVADATDREEQKQIQKLMDAVKQLPQAPPHGDGGSLLYGEGGFLPDDAPLTKEEEKALNDMGLGFAASLLQGLSPQPPKEEKPKQES